MDVGAKLCRKWQPRLLRWFLLCTCWSTYILYRGFVVGQILYDRKSGKMVIRPRNILTIRIAIFLKIFIFINEHFWVPYFILGFFPFAKSSRENTRLFLERFMDAVATYITLWNICRLYIWLRSLSWNRSFVRLANKVIGLASSVEDTLGPVSLEGSVLLIIYVVNIEFTLLECMSYIHAWMNLSVVYVLLQEVFYNAYIAYLFLLLSWIASFNRFLENHRMMGLPISQQRQKILKLFHLYSRINNGHQDIIVLWLPVASVLLSNVVMMVCHWAAIIYIVLFNQDLDTAGKWNWIFHRHLGGGLAPLFRILLIGLCNDRLAHLERCLSLQFLFIDLRHRLGSGERSQSFTNELTNLQTCFDVQLRTQPIRNPIMCKHQICDSSFIIEFVFCVLVNALSYVQFGISNGTDLDFNRVITS